MLEKLTSILHLTHPVNGLSAAFAVFLGYWGSVIFNQTSFELIPLLLGITASYLVSAGGFIINDIVDIEIDLINRPSRPLPSKKISIQEAWFLYGLFSLLGLALAWLISWQLFTLSLFFEIVLASYSLLVKRILFLGHFFVALAGCFSLIYGGLIANQLVPTVYTVPALFLAFIAREILKTIPDAEGDKRFGVKNLTTIFGQTIAAQAARLFFVLAFIAYAMLAMIFNSFFAIYLLVFALPLVVFLLLRIKFLEDINRTIFLSKMVFLAIVISIPIGSISV